MSSTIACLAALNVSCFPFVRRAGELYGRDHELCTVAGGARQFVFVEGHPGVGKTSLLEAARTRAELSGSRVLWSCGQELEREFTFGIARQLFERVVHDASPAGRTRLFGGSAALAGVALGVERAGEAEGPRPDSPFPFVHALFWLTVNLSEGQRLAIFVDDVHWADPLSLRFLDYLSGRLEGMSVSVVAAARPTATGAQDSDVSLERLRARAGRGLVLLGPLRRQAVAALVGERFGMEPASGLVTACVEATGGNPYLLGELTEALLADHVAPDAAEDVIARLGPETVARSVMLRLARLPATAGPVAEAVAVLDAHAEIRHVAALTGLSIGQVCAAADALEAANVLDRGRPLRFVHPIVRQAVYEELAPGARTQLHARAAESLIHERAEPERVAAHLLLAEPARDPCVVEVLREAAAVALSGGAAELAKRFLCRALNEPPPAEELANVLAELGLAEALSGHDLEIASLHLERAAAETVAPAVRCERVRKAALIRLYRGDFSGAIGLLRRERAALTKRQRSLGLNLLADEAGIGVLAPWTTPQALHELEEHADLAGEEPSELAVLAELAAKRWLEGRIEEAAKLASRALSGDHLLAAQGPLSVAFNHAVAVLIDADRFEEADGPLEAGLALARQKGSILAIASISGLAVVAAWRKGVLLQVESLAREVLDLFAASETPLGDPNYWAYLAATLVERGELERAEEAIASTRVGAELPNLTYSGMPFVARARLRLAQARADEALADLLELRSRERSLGVRHMRFTWRRDAVQAALALGDRDLARELAAEQYELTLRWELPSARGVALSTQGLVTTGRKGLGLLEQGAALLAKSPARLHHARALFDLGSAQRREGLRTKARESLRASIELARGCGATALASRAHEELVTAGARPRRLQFSGLDALTASERRVATLAAVGKSNREIAVALFIAVRTVENHLASSYQKLGIRSRSELASAFASDPAPPPGTDLGASRTSSSARAMPSQPTNR